MYGLVARISVLCGMIMDDKGCFYVCGIVGSKDMCRVRILLKIPKGVDMCVQAGHPTKGYMVLGGQTLHFETQTQPDTKEALKFSKLAEVL